MTKHWTKHISILFLIILLSLQAISQDDNLSNLSEEKASSQRVSSVIVTFESNPSYANVTKTKLKYNKEFALSFHIKNGNKEIYTHAFPFLNGGSIDEVVYPGLTFTDGCGNPVNFKMGTSLYSFAADGFTDIHTPQSNEFINWEEAAELYQAGWGIFSQGLLPDNSGDPSYSIARNQSYVKFKTHELISGGIPMTVLMNPQKDNSFTTPAFDQGYRASFSNHVLGIPYTDIDLIPLSDNLEMSVHPLDAQQSLASIADAMHNNFNPSTRLWASADISTITDENSLGYSFSVFQFYMEYLENKYGSGGLDNMWMTNELEVWDYISVYNNISIPPPELLGNRLLITFTGDLPSQLDNYALSLLVESDANIKSIEIAGGTFHSSKVISNTTALINLNWDESVLIADDVIAEEYVAKAESSGTTNDALVAMDYVNMLSSDSKKEELRNRLCAITTASMPTGYCSCEFSLGDDMLICSGDRIDLTAPDDNTYLWSTGATTQTIQDFPVTNSTYSVTVRNQYNCTSSATIHVTVHPTFEIQTSEDVIVCPNESIDIWADGGETYFWEESGETTDTIRVSSDVARYYTVSVFDEIGCEIKGSVFVDVHALPNANAGEDVSICPEGAATSATLTATGGVRYEWSNEAETNTIVVSPTSSTLYTVTVYSEQGCSATDDVLVTIRETPSIDAGSDINKCVSDCVSLQATGGISYTWSNGSMGDVIQVCPTTETTYIVTGTNAFGCTASDDVTVRINDYPDVSLLGISPAYCEGDAPVVLEGTPAGGTFGGVGVVVSESIFSPTIAGVGEHKVYYSVITDGMCAVGDTMNVHIYEYPQFNLGEDVTLCTSDTLEIFVPTGYDQYLWSNGNTSGRYLMVEINRFGIGTTVVELIATDNGCVSRDEIEITFESCNVGIEDLEDIGIKLYPNPNTGIFNISYDGTEANQYFSIYTVQGQEVYYKTLDECRDSNCKTTIDVSSFNKGVYLIRFYSKKGIRTGKLILQ